MERISANVGRLNIANVSWFVDQFGTMTDYGVRLQTRTGQSTWLSFKPYQPGITLGYMQSLAREGYVGLQRIPRWAIKRERRRADAHLGAVDA